MNQIHQFIKNNGATDIASFMNEVMFNPKHGYYKSQDPVGAKQDFITAPEICSAFSILIAKYFVSIIHSQYQKNEKVVIVEMGAGNGTLFFDLVNTINNICSQNQQIAATFSHGNYAIIETNPILQQKQQQKLKNFNINWFENFEKFEQHFSDHKIYFIANELFDCLPIHQFSYNNNQWREILLTSNQNNQINKTLEPFNQSKHNLIDNIYKKYNTPPQNNIIFEHSFTSEKLMQQISSLISKNSGLGLIIDYGYQDLPGQSTLQAIKNHQKVDIFSQQDPYQCDLTSLVNFKSLQNQAQQLELQTSLISQANFLQALNIDLELEKALQRCDEKDQNNIKSAFNRLINPQEMGELFKCLIFWQEQL